MGYALRAVIYAIFVGALYLAAWSVGAADESFLHTKFLSLVFGILTSIIYPWNAGESDLLFFPAAARAVVVFVCWGAVLCAALSVVRRTGAGSNALEDGALPATLFSRWTPSLLQVLLVVIVANVFYRSHPVCVDYYYARSLDPLMQGTSYHDWCVLHPSLAWLFGTNKTPGEFYAFCLTGFFTWLAVVAVFIRRAVASTSGSKVALETVPLLALLFYPATLSFHSWLGVADPFVAMFVAFVLFCDNSVVLVAAAALGTLSHSSLFVFAAFSAVLVGPAGRGRLRKAAIVLLSVVAGVIALRIFHYVIGSEIASDRFSWILRAGELSFWIEFNLRRFGDFGALQGPFWMLSAAMLVMLWRGVGIRKAVAYAATIGLGLAITFVSADRPRIFASVAWPGFLYAMLLLVREPATRRPFIVAVGICCVQGVLWLMLQIL